MHARLVDQERERAKADSGVVDSRVSTDHVTWLPMNHPGCNGATLRLVLTPTVGH
jgi:hypothetical protein